MKEGAQHIVPLCSRAVEILQEVWGLTPGPNDYIFPGETGDGHLSSNAMLYCLNDLWPEATVHGLRSTFRDWAGDCTDL